MVSRETIRLGDRSHLLCLATARYGGSHQTPHVHSNGDRYTDTHRYPCEHIDIYWYADVSAHDHANTDKHITTEPICNTAADQHR